MKIDKRIILFVLCMVVSAQVAAVLPVLALAEVADAVVSAIVVRSVGRVVVTSVGTAANDATWGTTFSSWITAGCAVGTVMLAVNNSASSVPANVEVQVGGAWEDLSTGVIAHKWRGSSSVTVSGVPCCGDLSLANSPVEAVNSVLNWFNVTMHLQEPIPPISNMDACSIQNGSFRCVGAAFSYAAPVVVEAVDVEAPDGIGRVYQEGGLFYADPDDPDWVGDNSNSINGVPAVRFVGEAGGRLAVVDVYAAAGGYGVEYQEQTGVSTVRKLGALLNANAIPFQLIAENGQGVLDSPGTQTGTNPVAGTWPEDYARAGEAAAAANILAPKLDTIAARLDPATFHVSTEVDPVHAMDDRITGIGEVHNSTPAINWMPSLLPGQAVACRSLPIDMNITSGPMAGIGGSASIDICDKFDIIRQILGYLFMVGTVVYCFRCFTRGNSAEA